MVSSGAYPIFNPKTKPRVRVTVRVKVGLHPRSKICLIQISFKDKSLKVFVKTNLLHLVSNFKR